MTATAPPRPTTPPEPAESHSIEEHTPPLQLPRWRGLVLYVALVIAYSAIGMVLALHYNLIDGDGPSRVANAGYTVFSRDPHLAAIGFVWNPLPSLVDIPLLQLSHLWEPIRTRGQAGTVQSALFMAGAVLVVRRIALDRHLPTVARRVVVVGFAIHPMIVQYGGNGLSEAASVFFTLAGVRHLLLWSRSRDIGVLALAGVYLGVSYLARYEQVAAIAGAVSVVVVIKLVARRGDSVRVARRRAADAALVVASPGVIAFLAWAGASWLLAGQALPQITSQYGNASYLSAAAAEGAPAPDTPVVSVQRIMSYVLAMEPLLLVAVVLAIVACWRRREADIAIPVAVFGAILKFHTAAQLSGETFGWFRFYIATVPLAVCAVLCLWSADETSGMHTGPVRGRSRGVDAARVVAACLVMAVAVPVCFAGVLDSRVGNQYGLRAIVDGEPRDQNGVFTLFQDDRRIAAFLDEQRLPDGSVLTDTFQGWGIWLASSRLEQFVITSDSDFYDALNGPSQFGLRYILVSNPAFDGGFDAVNQRYPTLWDTGAGIGVLTVRVLGPNGLERWRIYQVAPDCGGPVCGGTAGR